MKNRKCTIDSPIDFPIDSPIDESKNYSNNQLKKAWVVFFDENIIFDDEVKYIKTACSDLLSRILIDVQEEIDRDMFRKLKVMGFLAEY